MAALAMSSCSSSPTLVASWIILTCLYLLVLQEQVVGKSIEKEIIDSAPKAEMFDAFHLMPHGEVMVMTELDLLLTLEQYKALHSSKSREKRKAVRDVNNRWTLCIVYYEITDSLKDSRYVIRQAMDVWEKYSCLQFKESTTAKQRIQFKDGGGCYSQLGMQDEPQPLVLARGCRTLGIIVHEIGHAVGWYHEHMRPDRDQFIQINFDVIPELYKPNFERYDSHVVNTYNIPYDYNSIMHYGSDALPGSITTLDNSYQEKIGQRQGMTFKDIKLANLMYDCASASNCTPSICSHSGFVLSNDHKGAGTCQCWCDSGNLDDPLVQCSKTNKDPPGPNTKPIVNPGHKLCFDVREDCQKLINQDGDVCMTKMKVMMASCSKSCDFCGKGESVCMDHEKGCPILAATDACKDEGMKPIMEKLCRASCGLCKPAEPCAVQHEMMGPAKENGGMRQASTWMLSYVVAGLGVSLRRRL